ncbi:winged helix-turn-helix transcriptional regulator [Paenibacillus methanolicus]|uniref:DNA-binding HxlR family transcriptional regulator n=1 Tax=Paenibacillus methanolicus TaxID=582686 RepID=A0A5S5BTQ6_9BACL|nr:helix-turn-helix domain-containing protein [Paenibacillus methanolicus]TYP68973.1 DNA-binding HxlR family transcriptional regulator [Paenibacillus methanolicus]
MESAKKTYHTAVEATLEVMGGKWKPVILFHLTFGRKRNGELMSLLPAVSQKVLTQQLRELEEASVIARIVHNQVPPKVEYELTAYGWTLRDILHAMCRWGDAHIERTYGQDADILNSPLKDGRQT